MVSAAWVLSVMLQLAATETITAPWASTYEDTANEIAAATDDPEMAAVLVAIGWHESRFNPAALTPQDGAKGVWQTVPYWGPPSAKTTVRVILDSFRVAAKLPKQERLAPYACGPHLTPRCIAISRHRLSLASRLLARPRMPQDRPVAHTPPSVHLAP